MFKLCLHVMCACPFASTSSSTLTLTQWLTQGMGFRPILCMCICVTIDSTSKLTLTLTQTGMDTLRVNNKLLWLCKRRIFVRPNLCVRVCVTIDTIVNVNDAECKQSLTALRYVHTCLLAIMLAISKRVEYPFLPSNCLPNYR